MLKPLSPMNPHASSSSWNSVVTSKAVSRMEFYHAVGVVCNGSVNDTTLSIDACSNEVERLQTLVSLSLSEYGVTPCRSLRGNKAEIRAPVTKYFRRRQVKAWLQLLSDH